MLLFVVVKLTSREATGRRCKGCLAANDSIGSTIEGSSFSGLLTASRSATCASGRSGIQLTSSGIVATADCRQCAMLHRSVVFFRRWCHRSPARFQFECHRSPPLGTTRHCQNGQYGRGLRAHLTIGPPANERRARSYVPGARHAPDARCRDAPQGSGAYRSLEDFRFCPKPPSGPRVSHRRPSR